MLVFPGTLIPWLRKFANEAGPENEKALALAQQEPERCFLTRRLAELK